MSDAATLLAWGRSLLSAKRNGGAGGAASGSSGTPVSPRGATAGQVVGGAMRSDAATVALRRAAEVRAMVTGRSSASSSDESGHRSAGAAAAAALRRGSRGDDWHSNTEGHEDDHVLHSTPTEATESHWERKRRMQMQFAGVHPVASPVSSTPNPSPLTSAAPTPFAPVNASAADGGVHSGGGRRRSNTYAGGLQGSSGGTAARHHRAVTVVSGGGGTRAHTDEQLAEITRRQEQILLERRESERRRLANLKSMSERNLEAFQSREAELLAELEALPSKVEARLMDCKSHHHAASGTITEEDLDRLEGILRELQRKAEEALDDETHIGKHVADLTAAAMLSAEMSTTVSNGVGSVCQQPLHHLVEAVEELRGYVVNAADLRAIAPAQQQQQHASLDPLLRRTWSLAVPTSEDLTRLLTAAATEGDVDRPPLTATAASPLRRTELVSSSYASEDTVRRYRFAVACCERWLEPVVASACTKGAALLQRQQDRLDVLQASLSDGEKEVDAQRVTMDEAHQALQQLMESRRQVQAEIHAEDQRSMLNRERAAVLQAKRESALDAHARYSARKADLEQRIQHLLEELKDTTRDLEAQQQEGARCELTVDSLRARAAQLRDSTREERSRCDAARDACAQITARIRSKEVELSSHETALRQQTVEVAKAEEATAGKRAQLEDLRAAISEAVEQIRAAKHRISDAERDTADHLHRTEGLTAERESLLHETENYRNEISHDRHVLEDVAREIRTLDLADEDLREELEIAKATLLYRDAADKERRRAAQEKEEVVGNHSARNEKGVPQRPRVNLFDDADRALFLHALDGPGSPEVLRLQVQRPTRPASTWAAEEDHRSSVRPPGGSRSRQWGRSSSRSTEPSPPTVSSSSMMIMPPEELETAQPPPYWEPATPAPAQHGVSVTNGEQGQFVPLLVSPAPRNYVRDMMSLKMTRAQQQSWQPERVDVPATGPSSFQPGSTTRSAFPLAPANGAVLESVVGQSMTRWTPAPAVHGGFDFPATTSYRGPTDSAAIGDELAERGSSEFSSAPGDELPGDRSSVPDATTRQRAHIDPAGGHADVDGRYDLAGGGAADDVYREPPFLHWRQHFPGSRDGGGSEAQNPPRQLPLRTDDGNSNHGGAKSATGGGQFASSSNSRPSYLPHQHPPRASEMPTAASSTVSSVVPPSAAAGQQRAGGNGGSKLKERLQHVQARLHRAVADHSTAQQRRPFR